MRILISISLFALSFTGCFNDEHIETRNNKKVVALNNRFDSILNQLSKNSSNIKDSIRFKEAWNYVLDNDSLFVVYLKKFKDSVKFYPWTSITVRRYNKDFLFRQRKSANVASMYLISAIYYMDYNFAYTPNLYFDDRLVNDTFFKKPILLESTQFTTQNEYTTGEEIVQGWETINNWFKLLDSMSLSSLRRNNFRPLLTSKLYWYGEIGGRINKKNYAGKL